VDMMMERACPIESDHVQLCGSKKMRKVSFACLKFF